MLAKYFTYYGQSLIGEIWQRVFTALFLQPSCSFKIFQKQRGMSEGRLTALVCTEYSESDTNGGLWGEELGYWEVTYF